MVAAVVAIWLRNRDILRDVYDYSTLIGAAGKTEAGFRPYTEVRSPMQTSVYYFNWLSERIFGASYLGLTWGGLVQALLGGFLLSSLLWRQIGSLNAIWFAGAIMLAGCIQHMGFFYNPVGIVCFAVVVVGLARGGCLWPWRGQEAWLVCAALFVGGTNKLNFQGLTLAFGGLLVLRSWLAGEITGRAFLGHTLVMSGAGVVLPFAFELLWTGATPIVWWREVVAQPTARFEAAKHFLDLRIFLQPANDFHHHILFRPIGGAGLLLLMLVGGWALQARRAAGARWLELLGIVCLIFGGAAGSALLMVTNYETVVLTSLAFLLSALAIFLLARSEIETVAQRWVQRVLMAGAILWTVDGGYAAWHGSRLLYAQNPPPRSDYERLVNAPKPLAYFEGVRFLKTDLAAMLKLSDKLMEMQGQDGRLTGVLFGPAVEWMERAYPESIVPHMPIWYHYGTSLATDDLDWFRTQLRNAGVTRIVVNPAWELWPPAIAAWLRDYFQAEKISENHVMYHPRLPTMVLDQGQGQPINSRTFRDTTGSNILLSASNYGDAVALDESPSGQGFFGASKSWRWDWPAGARDFTGTAIATSNGSTQTEVVFRVLMGEAENEELIWEMPVTLGPGNPEVRRSFVLRTDGRPLRFEARTLDGSGAVKMGWRDMHISYAGESLSAQGLPVLPWLMPISSDAAIADENGEQWFARSESSVNDQGWVVPFENWRRSAQSVTHAKVSVKFTPNQVNPADPVVVALMWYRAGRREIMSEHLIDLRTTLEITLEANLPEPYGWVGLVVRPAGGKGVGHSAHDVAWAP